MPKKCENGVNVSTGSGGVNPSVQVEGDIWHRADLHRMWFRNDTGNVEIHGHLTNYNSSAINATTAKTTIVSTALTTGVYRFQAEILVSASSGTLAPTIDFSGTSTASTFSLAELAATIASGTVGSQANFGATTGLTAGAAGLRRVFGTIAITVAGTLTISLTAGTSFTVPALGAYLDCWRFA